MLIFYFKNNLWSDTVVQTSLFKWYNLQSVADKYFSGPQYKDLAYVERQSLKVNWGHVIRSTFYDLYVTLPGPTRFARLVLHNSDSWTPSQISLLKK